MPAVRALNRQRRPRPDLDRLVGWRLERTGHGKQAIAREAYEADIFPAGVHLYPSALGHRDLWRP